MMKRKALSLALALALCLGLAAPALAVEFPYTVECSTDIPEEAVPGGSTILLSDWEYNAGADDYMLGEVYEKPLNAYYLPLVDTRIVVKKVDGSGLDGIWLRAWSDPDGDGVYAQRTAIAYDTDDGLSHTELLPPNTTSVNEAKAARGAADAVVTISTDWPFDESNQLELVSFFFDPDTRYELQISPLYLAQLFGKNTFLSLDFLVEDTYFSINYLIPDVPIPSAPAVNTAYASTQTVQVDGKAVEFQCYALKDQSGNPTNYIKLRDLALLLSGTAAQFEVGWDGDVSITTGKAYTPNGSELKTPFSGDRTYSETDAVTKVNGQTADLAAFMLTDDQGGGYTYYQLRDLGKTLGFNVGWSAEKGVYIETDRPYDPNN